MKTCYDFLLCCPYQSSSGIIAGTQGDAVTAHVADDRGENQADGAG